MGSFRCRLDSLEDRLSTPQSPARIEARRKMTENLDRIAALRRSDSPEDRAELEAIIKGVEQRIEEVRCG